MSRRVADREYRIIQAAMSAVYVLLIAIVTMATAVAGENDAARVSSSTHYAEGGRDGGTPSAETRDRFAALDTTSGRESPAAMTTRATAGGTPETARAMANDFWIYDADVLLFGDDDNDGYFYGIDLLFDADTIWSSARVYAVVYLSLDGGRWNEYAVTDDFRIEGASSNDEYVLVTELESGYPSGDYDILIELYDAYSGDFLADFGPEDSSALGYLPLEDYNRDAPFRARPVAASHGHGGGSAGWLTLLCLCGAGLLRVLRQRRPD